METTLAQDPVKQFSVFIENRVGRLHELTAMLAKHNVHIMAMTTLDTTDCSIDRMVVDDPDRARELMAANNFFFTECDILAVEFSDESKLQDIFKAFYEVEMNIHYVYSFVCRPRGRSAIALNVEDIDLAQRALSNRGFKILTQRDISR
ncbi:MAG TPA: acetolactate synthase [Acidobacteriota bacterium]|nr:acetolactate synthase [Acidobacteriota bacterium]